MKIFLTTLIILLIHSNCFSQNNYNYSVLNSANPSDTVFTDFKQLDSIFKDMILVGAGESTHGTHEFTTMRHRLFRYLVENHQFNTFFLEADYGACLRVNNYIHGNNNDSVRNALKEVQLWPWKTEEMVELIEWMKLYNAKHNQKIDFVGCDMQLLDDDYLALKSIFNENNLKTPDFLIHFSDENKLKKDSTLLIQTKLDWNSFLVNFDTTIFEQKTKNEFNFISKTVNQWFEYELLNDRNNKRDSCMSANIYSYLNTTPNSKGMYFAHNGHVAKIHHEIKKSYPFNRAGYFLNDYLNSKYYVIGLEMYKGEFNAFEYEKNKFIFKTFTIESTNKKAFGYKLYKLNENYIFYPTSTLSSKKPFLLNQIGAVYGKNTPPLKGNIYQYRQYNLKTNFDAILFIKNTSPTNIVKY